jgi:Fur family ferric uptake transcriptional regulator
VTTDPLEDPGGEIPGGRSRNQLHMHHAHRTLASVGAQQFDPADPVLALLRARGLRMTPQRRAIVSEVMGAEGHISPTAVARRVRDRVPGVNPSTVYRTLDLLEDLGVLSHAHLESGAEYHRSSESDHVHLTCSRCGSQDSLSMAEATRLKRLITTHRGFGPDLTHFAISGLCAPCQGAVAARSR